MSKTKLTFHKPCARALDLHVMLSPQERKRLKELAKKQGISQSGFVRFVLTKTLLDPIILIDA
jgi:hypothetical protein